MARGSADEIYAYFIGDDEAIDINILKWQLELQ